MKTFSVIVALCVVYCAGMLYGYRRGLDRGRLESLDALRLEKEARVEDLKRMNDAMERYNAILREVQEVLQLLLPHIKPATNLPAGPLVKDARLTGKTSRGASPAET